MIKFFRHIRRSLIEKNHIGKYFKYAIGEILLVVIGILIAISLNNSNQTEIRNSNSEEKLTKLRQLIYQDSINISQTIDYSEAQIAKIQAAIDLFNKDFSQQEYHTIMKNLFFRSGPRTTPLDRSIYEEMLNSGEFSNIQDIELKQRITAYYTQYEHFWWIIKNYIENSELPALLSIIYREDIIRKRYLEEIIGDQNSHDGFEHFKKAVSDSKNYGRFENYAFAYKELHELIIIYHDILKKSYIKGLAINPNITKG